mmetsp:Transcript_7897/g.16896  ORF Transcript_7897/g.16896 Transcript_7897/m.16896 type:complete len:90 (-) Transcript_7897:43-312(-)
MCLRAKTQRAIQYEMEFFPRDQVEEDCCCIEFVIASHLKKSALEGKSLCPRSFTRVVKQNGTCRGGKGSGQHIGREMGMASMQLRQHGC